MKAGCTPRTGRTGGPHQSHSHRSIMAEKVNRDKNLTRPKKRKGAKARRQRDQKKRLITLGMDEAKVASLNARQVLDLLKRPAKVVKACAETKS